MLKHQTEGTVLVVRPPCRLKTCADCWPLEAERLKGLLTSTFATCRTCSTLITSIGISATEFDAFKRWAQRHQRIWVAIPLTSGDLWVLLEGQHPASLLVSELDRMVELAINSHDRTRRLSASKGIRLTERNQAVSPWTVMVTSSQQAEQIFEEALEMQLVAYWSGPNQLRIEASEDQLKALIERISA